MFLVQTSTGSLPCFIIFPSLARLSYRRMQVVHSFIDVFIRILLDGLIFIMRHVYFNFVVGASAPRITFVKGITIPMIVFVTSDPKSFVDDSSLLFESLQRVVADGLTVSSIGSPIYCRGSSFRRLHESMSAARLYFLHFVEWGQFRTG
jgi:hypothetical protein